MENRMHFDEFLQQSLNDAQRAAVTASNGAFLVIAGAGSGKTRVITARVANLIVKEHVLPSSIVALTFTNKAAGEMRERLQHFLGGAHSMPMVSTFHAYCLYLLRGNAHLLKNPQFSILDSDDQLELVKKIIKTNALQKQFTASSVVSTISQYKNKLAAGVPTADMFLPPLLQEVYLTYESEKAAAHYLDFDDLINCVVDLFAKNEEFKKRFQKRIRHIMVDEYQDTSVVQHYLLKLMALDDQKFALDSLCAVGDEDQSIYSWRGANATNMLQFQHDFAPVSTIKIEQNYRSVKPILAAANSLIANNQLRNPKTLWSSREAQHRIISIKAISGEHEAALVAAFLTSLPSDKRLSDVAILYRTHYQSRNIEEALIASALPYRIIGGIRFYERKEIKDLLAYLRLIANPYDKISFLRVLNCPPRGLGAKGEEAVLQAWLGQPLLDVYQIIEQVKKESPAARSQGLDAFLSIFSGLTFEQKPSVLLDAIITRTAYISYLQEAYDEREAEAKIENVREFTQAIASYEQRSQVDPDRLTSAQMPLLISFLEEVALLQEKVDDDNRIDQVQLMTLHAAKGLEFDTVIITGIEEDILPSSRSLHAVEQLEEERRLFYVGITRAKERLLLLHAQERNVFGQFTAHAPSRFLDEVPKAIIAPMDAEHMTVSQARAAFTQWFLGMPPHVIPERKASVHGATSMREQQRPATIPSNLIRPAQSGATGAWRKNDRVRHAKFGIGIVTDVEKSDEQNYHITAVFSIGKKTILSSFLQKM